MHRLFFAAALGLILGAATPAGAQTWTFAGPAPVSNGQTSPTFAVSGAVRSILVSPTDNNTLYVGTVNGGIWRTTDGGSNWSPLTDSVGSLSIGAMSFDPTSNGQTVIAGFGRFSSYGRTGGNRLGLIYSTNGGNSWTNITSLNGGPDVSGVAARGSTIVVAVDTANSNNFGNVGIFRSTNGGTSFTRISGASGTGLPWCTAVGLFEDPTNANELFTATSFARDANFNVISNGIYRSTDGGATWQQVSNATMNAAMPDSNPNVQISARGDTVVAGLIGSNGQLNSIWYSTNNGNTWTQFANAPQTNPGGQGSIHFTLTIDPSDTNLVYVTGDATQTSPFNGIIHRLNLSTGTSTALYSNGNNAPHADGRALAIRTVGGTPQLLHGGDGGIAQLSNPSGTFGTWGSLNGNLGTLEVHRAAYDVVSGVAFGGTQDNGTVRQSTPGNTVYTRVLGGDGADVATVRDPTNANQSLRYFSSQFLGGFRRNTYDSTGAFVTGTNPALNVVGTGQNIYQNDSTIQFYTPIATNRADGNRLYIGTRKIYESTDQGSNLTILKDFGSGFTVRAIAAGGFTGSTPKPEVLYVGVGNDSTGVGQLWLRPDTGGSLTPLGAYTGGRVVDVAMQPTDWQHIAVASSTQYYRSTNAGTSFDTITGDLITGNTNNTGTNIFSVETLRVGSTDYYLAGTRDGVYITNSNSLGDWTVLGNGLPTGVITDMDYYAETDTLIVADLGRGIWMIENFSVALVPEPTTVLGLAASGLGLAALIRRRVLTRRDRRGVGEVPSAR